MQTSGDLIISKTYRSVGRRIRDNRVRDTHYRIPISPAFYNVDISLLFVHSPSSIYSDTVTANRRSPWIIERSRLISIIHPVSSANLISGTASRGNRCNVVVGHAQNTIRSADPCTRCRPRNKRHRRSRWYR